MGRDTGIEELLNAPEGKPAGFAIGTSIISYSFARPIETAYKPIPSDPWKPEPHPDEGREFAQAYAPQAQYEAWQEYLKGKEEPQYEMVIDTLGSKD